MRAEFIIKVKFELWIPQISLYLFVKPPERIGTKDQEQEADDH